MSLVCPVDFLGRFALFFRLGLINCLSVHILHTVSSLSQKQKTYTILTDLVQVLPLMQENIEANGFTSSSENNNGSTSKKKKKKKKNTINTLKRVEAHTY